MTAITSERRERCDVCEAETDHEVSIELRVENPHDEDGFSREPYRVARCRRCGAETATRMNDV